MKRTQLFLLAVLITFFPLRGFSQLAITVESGLVVTQYNDVRAPNQDNLQGSLFSLNDDFREVQVPVYFRAEARYLIASKHTVELTAAPLTVESSDFSANSVEFEGETFRGNDTEGRYQFNTYRATYRYRILDRPKFLLDLGATLLVRDAAITLSQGGTEASNTDLGFVPLVSLYTQYAFSPTWQAVLKADALVGPVGRAEDVFLGLQYKPTSALAVKAGYRLIEGGADVDQVYNFAFFHFAALGLVYEL